MFLLTYFDGNQRFFFKDSDCFIPKLVFLIKVERYSALLCYNKIFDVFLLFTKLSGEAECKDWSGFSILRNRVTNTVSFVEINDRLEI